MSLAYASTLLQRGMGVQDVGAICRMDRSTIQAIRPVSRRQEYRYYPKGQKYGPPSPTRHQMVLATIEAIAIRHGCTLSDVLGKSRIYTLARQEAMYALREKWKLSRPRIGQIMGGRHHTTVLHGCRRHEARLAGEGRV